jgi:hypothetical protein
LETDRRISVGLRRIAGVLLLGAIGFSCSEDELTMLGADLRSAPPGLADTLLTTVQFDSVFLIPVSLGASGRGQLGTQGAYTTHVLYNFFVPTTFEDSIALSAGRVGIDMTQVGEFFSGTMRIALREIAPEARDWSIDSVLTGVPELTDAIIAAPETLRSEDLGEGARLEFIIDLAQLADFDSVMANEDSLLEVNVALLFDGFESGGPGFVEYPYLDASNIETASFNATYDDVIELVVPDRRLTVVEFDTTYSPGTNLVASDGWRLHSFINFADVSTVLPESAFVERADLILVQADFFGWLREFGVMVPSDSVLIDSTLVFSEAENTRALAFSTSIPAADGTLKIEVTRYLFDQQEGSVVNRGMLLRLSNEGTSARHFEFYGPRDAMPERRPRIQIIYGLPADFGETQP